MYAEVLVQYVAILCTGLHAWSGLFLITHAPTLASTATATGHRRFLAPRVDVLSTPARLLGLTQLIGALALFRGSLILPVESLVPGTQPAMDVIANSLIIGPIWAPVAWAFFARSLHFDSKRRRRHARTIVLVGLFLSVFTLLAIWTRLRPGGLGWPWGATLIALWAFGLFSWALYSFVQCYREVAPNSQDAVALRWLIAAATTALSLPIGSGIRSWALGDIPIHPAPGFFLIAMLVLLLDWTFVAIALVRYGAAGPSLGSDELRHEFVSGGRTVLVLCLIQTTAIALAVSFLELNHAMILLVFASAVVTHSVIDNRWRGMAQRGALRDELVRTLEQRDTELRRQLAQSQTIERTRMGKMIHDCTLNPIASVATTLGTLRAEIADGRADVSAVARTLEQAAEFLRTCSAETRGIVDGMFRPELMRGDLHAVLVSATEERAFLGAFKAVDTSELEPVRGHRFELFAAQQLYFLVLEGLNNAAKHMPRSRVAVGASLNSERVCVYVTSTAPTWNDGPKGTVDPAQPGNGHAKNRSLGLAWARESFETVGGRVEFSERRDQDRTVAILKGELPIATPAS